MVLIINLKNMIIIIVCIVIIFGNYYFRLLLETNKNTDFNGSVTNHFKIKTYVFAFLRCLLALVPFARSLARSLVSSLVYFALLFFLHICFSAVCFFFVI